MAVRELPDSKLEELKWKALFYGFPFLFALCYSTSGVVMGPAVYTGGWYCESSFVDQPAWGFFALGITLFTSITILWCMVRLGWHMYQAEKAMDRFRQTAGGTADRTKTIQVCKQGIAYTVVYLVITVPWVPYWMRIDPVYGYRVFLACIFPLQGLLNALVYFRPRYATERKKGNSRMAALATVLNTTDVSSRLSIAIIAFKPRGAGASAALQVNTPTNVIKVENGGTSRNRRR